MRRFGKLFALALAAAGSIASIPVDAEPRHETIFQIGTHNSLSRGGYDGAMTVTDLLKHGNFGLGTWDKLNGEGMIVDGKAYRGDTDMKLHVMPGSMTTPFFIVAPFHPTLTAAVGASLGAEAAQKAIEKEVPLDLSQVQVVRMDGTFSVLKLRSESGQNQPYRRIDEALKTDQIAHDFTNIQGTLIGLRFPKDVEYVNKGFWHWHFVSKDRTIGGHVLDFTTGPNATKAHVVTSPELLVHFAPEPNAIGGIDRH